MLTDAHGQRFRSFREAGHALVESDWEGWLIRGPRTALWVVKFMGELVTTPTAYHSRWRSHMTLGIGDNLVAEHECLSRALEAFLSFDQLEVSNLAGIGLMVRRLQLFEEKYRYKIADPEASQDSHLYMGGLAGARGELCICPLRSEWIAKQLQKESAVMKERRKAGEERVLARPKKGGKGGGADAQA